MDEEWGHLTGKGTWDESEPGRLPPGRKPIRTKWIFKRKLHADGSVARYKARLVAQGFSQVEGEDYFETSAPVARMSTLRTVFSIAAARDFELVSMDVDAAYLNAPVEEELYVSLPDDFSPTLGRPFVRRLRKSLYGLKQSGKNWYNELHEFLTNIPDLTLTRSDVDPCLYVSRDEGGEPDLVIAVYVDDLAISGKEKSVETFKRAINGRFQMKDLGELTQVLGIEVVRDRSQGTITIHQGGYIREVLQRYDFEACRGVGTPVEGKVRNEVREPARSLKSVFKNIGNRIVSNAAKLEDHESREDNAVDKTYYRGIVGSLMYASNGTRPDIAYAVHQAARHSESPTQKDLTACKRILRYLSTTPNLGITYGAEGPSELTGYVDADWAEDVESRRSTTGYAFKLNGGAISWCSRRQQLVTLSSTEAEYVAAAEAGKEVLHLRSLLSSIGLGCRGSTVVFEDNKSTIKLSEGSGAHCRTKHIGVRWHALRDWVRNGELSLEYIPTGLQQADILTKAVGRVKFQELRGLLMSD